MTNVPPGIAIQIDLAARGYGVTVEAIMTGSRVGDTSRARAYLCHQLRAQKYTLPQIGRFLGMHHTSVLYVLRRPASGPRSVRPRADTGEPACPDLSGEWAI